MACDDTWANLSTDWQNFIPRRNADERARRNQNFTRQPTYHIVPPIG